MRARGFRVFVAACLGLCLAGVASLAAEEPAKPQHPTSPVVEQHAWLAKLAGEWETEATASFGPDDPPVKMKGVESAKLLGGRWLIIEGKCDLGPDSVESRLTLGYDADKKKFVGTWIDSMNNHLWHYVGTLDETGRKLTLETEGPSPIEPGATCKYRESIELKEDGSKVFTAVMQTKDGQWAQFLTIHGRKQK